MIKVKGRWLMNNGNILDGKVKGMKMKQLVELVMNYEGNEGEYKFKVKGNEYVVQCYYDEGIMGIMFDEFGIGKRDDISITKDVIDTVVKIVSKEVDNRGIEVIRIPGTSRSRVRVYLRIAEAIGKAKG